jgi:hypothetical protein
MAKKTFSLAGGLSFFVLLYLELQKQDNDEKIILLANHPLGLVCA